MGEQSRSDVLDSLPSRPLTMSEGEVIANKEYDDIHLAPLSVLMYQGDHVVSVLWIVNEMSEMSHLIGYNPTIDGWEEIKSFPEDDWTMEKQEDTIHEWVYSTYGEEFVDHMFLEV